jgi:hypothetical protein
MDHKEYLAEAKRIVDERGAVYGGVEESFTRAATIANAILDMDPETPITARDVAAIMLAVKIARMAGNLDKPDNYIDAINYLAFMGEFAEAEQEPAEAGASEEFWRRPANANPTFKTHSLTVQGPYGTHDITFADKAELEAALAEIKGLPRTVRESIIKSIARQAFGNNDAEDDGA